MKKSYHVVPHNGEWAARAEGNERVTRTASTQQEAFQIARELAINNQSEVVIHRPNDKIRGSNSYGNDPFSPKG